MCRLARWMLAVSLSGCIADEIFLPFFVCGLLAWPALAVPRCQPRPVVLELMSEKYKEAPIAVGITNSGHLFEIFSTFSGSTWTLIVTSGNGMSCIVDAGQGWREVTPIRPELGRPL